MATATEIRESQLKGVMKEVSAALAEMFKSETLAKGLEGSSPEGSSPASPPAGSPPVEGSSPAGSPPVEGSSPEGSSPAGSPPPDRAAPEGSAPAAGGDTLESLTQDYLQLGQQDPEQLKMHYLACTQAIEQLTGGQGQGDPGAAPAGPPAGAVPAGPPAGAPPAPAMKSEKEKELEGKVEALEKAQSSMIVALGKFLGVDQKAVTGVSDVRVAGKPGTEPAPAAMSKSEAIAKLNEVTKRADLKKSDRDRINQFAVGAIGIEEIKDLLGKVN